MAENTFDLISTENRKYWEVTTTLGAERCVSFTWRLRNFSCWPTNCYRKIQSPSFSSCSSEWALGLHPNGLSSKYPYSYIYLTKTLPKTEMRVGIKICLKDKHGNDKYLHSKVFDYPKEEYSLEFRWDCTFKTMIEESAELMLNDVITIYCEVAFEEIIVLGEQQLISWGNDVQKKDSAAKTAVDILVNDFEALLRQQKNCDVTLEVGSEKLPAHKLILGARSKVFAAMFEHDTKESRSNGVTIIDIQPAVMKELLRYIYSGSVGEMSVEKATGLYVAADKYDLPKLKSQCADFLVGNLSVDNAVDVAVLADAHNDGMVIDSVKMFALKNAALLSTEKWKQLVGENARLAYEITRALVPQVCL